MKRFRILKQRRGGFTLIELTWAAIIAILSVMIVPWL